MTVNITAIPAALSMSGPPSASDANTPQIPSDNRYQPMPLVVHVIRLGGADALRLVHAMLHTTFQDNPDWTSDTYLAPEGGYYLPLRSLHATIGPAASSDSRSFHRDIAVLKDSGIFDVIEVVHGGQVLHWVYRSSLVYGMSHDKPYEIPDNAADGDLNCAVPITIYARICLLLRGALVVTPQDVQRLDAAEFTQERVASRLP